MSDEAALCTNKNAACNITRERTHKNNRRIYYITPHSARTRACFWGMAPPFFPCSHSHRKSISSSSSSTSKHIKMLLHRSPMHPIHNPSHRTAAGYTQQERHHTPHSMPHSNSDTKRHATRQGHLQYTANRDQDQERTTQ